MDAAATKTAWLRDASRDNPCAAIGVDLRGRGGQKKIPMTSRSLRHRAPLLWLLLPLMAGLVAGRAGWLPAVPGLLAGIAATGALLTLFGLRRGQRGMTAGLLVLSVALSGAALYHLQSRRLAAWETLPPREARLTFRVTRLFAAARAGHTGGLAVVTMADPPLTDLQGQRVCFSLTLGPGVAAPVRGCELAATGLLQALPLHPPAGSFEETMVNAGMNFQLTRGRGTTLVRPAPAYDRFCAWLLVRMEALLNTGLEDQPERAAVYRAMMLGQKQELSPEQHELFMHSGTMHLFAINGLHIGVVALTLHFLLACLRCPRLPAGLLVLAVLWLDVDSTGASPSAVRAFLMVAMLEAAWMARRPSNPLAAIAAAALLTLLLNPLDLFSASFQMSYAVVGMILLLGLPLAERLQARWPAFPDLPQAAWRWHHHGRAWLRRRALSVVSMGGAATLVSSLTSVEYFGVFVTGGLMANLLLMPLASLVIMTGVASLILGLAGAVWVSRLCNECAGLVLGLIEWFIRLGARVPGACWTAQYRAEWIGPVALAVVVAAGLAGYATGWRRERGGFWPPIVIVVLTLIGGVKFG